MYTFAPRNMNNIYRVLFGCLFLTKKETFFVYGLV